MKKLAILFVFAALFAACEKKLPSTGTFGNQEMTANNAIPIGQFIASVGDEAEKEGKVSGTITQVCQGEGCWFNLDLGEDKFVHIYTKESSFSLPKDASGKTAIAEGKLIAKEGEEGKQYEFEATGVIIQ
jgi:hypothetical protein